MFDEYEEMDYCMPVYTEKDVNKTYEKLQEKKRELRYKKGLYTTATIGIIGGAFLIPTIMGCAIGTAVGRSPFKREDVVRTAHVKTEFNSDGEVESTKQYVPYANEKSELRYYSDWVKLGDKYVNCETTYDVSGLTLETVEGLIKIKGTENKTFGDPVNERIISKETISKEELEKGEHYEGTIYKVDKSDTVVTPQLKSENKVDIDACIVMPGTVGIFTGLIGLLFFRFSKTLEGLVDSSLDLRDTKQDIKDIEKWRQIENKVTKNPGEDIAQWDKVVNVLRRNR